MRVLVLGSGGREHALARALAGSPEVTAVHAAPGSDAMVRDGARRSTVPGRLEDPAFAVAAAREAGADLVVIGPEAPLAAGAADALRSAGFAVFGPGREGARIEASKVWAKAFMARHGIPTAEAAVFDDAAAAEAHIRSLPVPPVVKADGLARGKGVVVAETHDQAAAAARSALAEGAFGAAGRRVVIEERLIGRELSVMALVSGPRCVLLAPAQDHKAVFDGDRGPNTGGMGAFSPVPWVDGALLGRIEREIIAPAAAGLAAEGIDYRGVLYAGLMLTDSGPRVLEFNCRFGDPEAQVVLPRLDGDWARLLAAVASGNPPGPVRWRPGGGVCVVLASGGYPGSYRTGLAIHGIEAAEALEGVTLYHAGTRREGDRWLTAGGRVLGVTAVAATLDAARRRAYEACGLITFPGRHHRRDIAKNLSQ
ncbi:MAG TPA: phosphoribosylamine--glycine ligase [Bacillota bacterium]